MHNTLSLADIEVGTHCSVSSVEVTGLLRRRILDLGIIPGTQVSCIRRSPAGNPTAYMVRGTVIALRNEDANQIKVLGG